MTRCPFSRNHARLLLFLSMLSGAAPVFSQNNFWERTNGPLSGKTYALVASPATGSIFAGIDRGVYRSDDDGETWTRVGLTGAAVFALEAATDGRVFAGTSLGVYYSIDNGRNWIPQGGLPTPIIKSLAVNDGGGTIFAGGNNGVIFRSADGGQTWTEVHKDAYFATDVQALAINAQDHVFAGTYGQKVWRSTDNGLTWTLLENGLTDSGIVSLAIRLQDQAIFAGTNGHIFRSADSGNNWTEVGPGFITTIYDLDISPAGAVFAASSHGVLKSINGSTGWTLENFGLFNTSLRSLTINDVSTDLFAGSFGDGVFRSGNFATSWEQVGLPSPFVFSLATNASQQIFAGTNDTLFVSNDGGQSWERKSHGIADFRISALAVDDPNRRIFAGSYAGIFRSGDGGASWTAVNAGLTNLTINTLAIGSSGYVFAGTNAGAFRWHDRDGFWSPVNAGLTDTWITALIVHPASAELFAATFLGGVFRSSDNGNSWSPMNGGWTFPPQVISFALDAAGAFIYAGTSSNGIYRAPLPAGNWTPAVSGIPGGQNVWVNALLLYAPGRLLAGLADEGVFHSTDNGNNWTALNGGLASLDIRSLTIDSTGAVYAGTNGSSGIYRSAGILTGVKEARRASVHFSLGQNYPNPFCEETTIPFTLSRSSHVTLRVLDVQGKVLAVLAAKELPPGNHAFRWNGGRYPAGIYYYSLQAGRSVDTGKMVRLE